MSDAIDRISIRQTLKLYASHQLSPLDVAKHYINRAKNNAHLNAFVYDMHDTLLEDAKAAEAKYLRKEARPFEGIIYGIKDLFCTKGIPTTACSKMLKNFRPTYESTVTHKLKKSGFLAIGKTNMDEFAMGSTNITSCFGPAYSPWGKNLTPGGSSGGSSAAVSARLCHVATGSDTGGSIRQPAAYTGLVGIKPTYGRCSRFGMVAFASSLDQAGIFGRTVDDAALALSQMMGHDPNDSTSINRPVPDLGEVTNLDAILSFKPQLSRNKKTYRIGIPTNLIKQIKNPDVRAANAAAIKAMQDSGMEIEEIELKNLEHGLSVYYIIAPAEASSNLARYDGVRFGHTTNEKIDNLDDLYKKSRNEGFGLEVQRRILIGTYVLSSKAMESYYIKAQKIRRIIFNEFKEAFSRFDAIFMPTSPTPAFSLNEISSDPTELYLTDIFTIPPSLAGLPAMSLPIGFSAADNDGNILPIGGQIICNHFEEAAMLNIASILEAQLQLDLEPKANLK